MDSNAPLTAKQRQGLLAWLCVLPAFFAGLYMSALVEGIGLHVDFVTVLKRGGVCSIPPAVFAVFFPRAWFIPTIAYSVGFSVRYKLDDIIFSQLNAGLQAAFFRGQHVRPPSARSNSELVWILLIAIWVAAFIAMLRLHLEKKTADR